MEGNLSFFIHVFIKLLVLVHFMSYFGWFVGDQTFTLLLFPFIRYGKYIHLKNGTEHNSGY